MPKPDSAEAVFRRLRTEEYFDDEAFEDVDLRGFDLTGKEFYRCTFAKCQLGESRWAGSKLEATVFRACDLGGALVGSAAFRGVRFENSKMMGIDWAEVSPNPEISFEGSKLQYASFVELNLRRASFVRCSLVDANFTAVDLTDAVFMEVDLTGSTFDGCTLVRTDFSTATGLFLAPGSNRLKDTRVPIETAILAARTLGMCVSGDR